MRTDLGRRKVEKVEERGVIIFERKTVIFD